MRPDASGTRPRQHALSVIAIPAACQKAAFFADLATWDAIWCAALKHMRMMCASTCKYGMKSSRNPIFILVPHRDPDAAFRIAEIDRDHDHAMETFGKRPDASLDASMISMMGVRPGRVHRPLRST